VPLQTATRAFLAFLRCHPELRTRIAAEPGTSIFYAGSLLKPIEEELADVKRLSPDVAQKMTLGDVLSRLEVPELSSTSMLSYVLAIEQRVPRRPDAFILWRALSGIYATNAVGKVSFQIGSGMTAMGRVFATTELGILLRNPHVDETSKDLLAYYDRCIRRGEDGVNVGFFSA
jgi:hypothetical protein